jgi:hypothetical protein
MTAATRELAERRAGSLEVALLWDSDTNRLSVCVQDESTGEHFHLAVRPAQAMEAFHHPYAYAAVGEAVPVDV